MEITFLGTGESYGIPRIGCHCPTCASKDKYDKRLRSSILIKEKEKIILIDCGPDFRYQMLRANCLDLDVLLITHSHFDHIAGLDNFFSFSFTLEKTLPVYLLDRDLEIIKKFFFYLFEKKGPSYVKFHKIKENLNFFIEDIQIEPLEIWHGKLPILGYKIGKIAYITDAKILPESTLEKLKNLDLLIVNALRKDFSPSHLILKESLEIIKYLTPKKAYLTHISHFMGSHKETEKELPKNVFLAYDELKLTL
jgi:phosphoribosyl 1,2-cyclic phosphate phosphodiesterase